MCDGAGVKFRRAEADSEDVHGGANTEARGNAEDDEICSHCLRVVPPDLGVENSVGDILCGACYAVLFKAKSFRLSPSRRKVKATL